MRCPRFHPRKCSCPLHPPPPGIGPGGAAHMGHNVYYLLSTGCHKPLFQSKNGGGFIYLYNSLVRILHLLRNFATFGTVAKIKAFFHMKRYKLIAVQISRESDKFERRLFLHNKKYEYIIGWTNATNACLVTVKNLNGTLPLRR